MSKVFDYCLFTHILTMLTKFLLYMLLFSHVLHIPVTPSFTIPTSVETMRAGFGFVLAPHSHANTRCVEKLDACLIEV